MIQDPTLFNRTEKKQFQQKILKETPEQKHWKKYKEFHQNQYDQSIKSVQSNNLKQLFAFTHGNILEIFNPHKNKNVTIQKLFNNEISSAVFRNDGKLIATGEQDGKVQLIEVKKRQPLRKFYNHNKPVFALQFLENQLLTGSDDMKIKLIDLQTEEIVRSYNNLHQDFIRSLQVLPNQGNQVLSSGYDGKINLFDINNDGKGLVFNHGSPVESISCLNNGFGFVSVGSYQTKLWDIRTNKILYEVTNNQKTITDCKIVDDRIITSSLDQHLKVLNVEGLVVTYQQKYQNPILSFDITNDKNFYALGLSNGTFLVKNLKKANENMEDEEEKEFNPDFMNNTDINSNRVRNFKFFNRGRHVKQENYDVKIVQKKTKILKHDQFLKKFQYKKGLMCVLRTSQTDLIMSYFDELIQRNALNIALTKLEPIELKIVLSFICRKIKNSNCNDILIDCLQILQENYNNLQNQELFDEVEQVLNDEIELQTNMLEVQGALETIINCNVIK